MTPSKPYLSLCLARLIAAEVTATALKQGLRVVVVVVDEGGHIVVLERMDNAAYGQIDDAILRARRTMSYQEKRTRESGKASACIEAHGNAIGAVSITASGASQGGTASKPIDDLLAAMLQTALEQVERWMREPQAA